MVSRMTIFSGFRTSLTVVFCGSSRMALTSDMLSMICSRLPMTSSDGSGMSSTLPTVALAIFMTLLSRVNALSMYQLVTSGKLSSLSVSPVGAVSMTTTS